MQGVQDLRELDTDTRCCTYYNVDLWWVLAVVVLVFECYYHCILPSSEVRTLLERSIMFFSVKVGTGGNSWVYLLIILNDSLSEGFNQLSTKKESDLAVLHCGNGQYSLDCTMLTDGHYRQMGALSYVPCALCISNKSSLNSSGGVDARFVDYSTLSLRVLWKDAGCFENCN
jgi:hypothetical protein